MIHRGGSYQKGTEDTVIGEIGYLADAVAWALPTRSVYLSFSAAGKTYQSSQLPYLDDEFLPDDAGNVQVAFDPKFPRGPHVVLTK